MLIPAYKVQEIALHLIYINKLKKKKKGLHIVKFSWGARNTFLIS